MLISRITPSASDASQGFDLMGPDIWIVMVGYRSETFAVVSWTNRILRRVGWNRLFDNWLELSSLAGTLWGASMFDRFLIFSSFFKVHHRWYMGIRAFSLIIRLMKIMWCSMHEFVLVYIRIIKTASQALTADICHENVAFKIKHLIIDELWSKHSIVVDCCFCLFHYDFQIMPGKLYI